MSPIMGAPAARRTELAAGGDVSNNSNNPGCGTAFGVASPANVVSRHSSSGVTGLDLEAIERTLSLVGDDMATHF